MIIDIMSSNIYIVKRSIYMDFASVKDPTGASLRPHAAQDAVVLSCVIGGYRLTGATVGVQ